MNELTSAGIPKRLRSKWLRGERMVNACSTLYLYHKVVPEGTARSEREAALKSLFDAVEGCGIPQENAAVAALLFMKRLTVAVGGAKLTPHNKAFGLIGAGLRKRFCPVFV